MLWWRDGLEGRRDREAEGLAGLAQHVVGAVELDGLLVAEGRGAGRTLEREEALEAGAGGLALRAGVGQSELLRERLVETQRVVSVEDAERRVDDGQDEGELNTVGHARNEVGSGDGLEVEREVDLRAADAVAVDELRAAVERSVERRDTEDALTKLPGLRVEGHAEVGEDVETHLGDDRDPVLDVGGEVGVAADGSETVDRQRNLHVAADRGIAGVTRNERTVGIREVEICAGGDEGIGRCGADVEAADVILTAAVDASEGRSDFATESRDRVEQDAVAQDVAALGVDAQTLHREELPPCDGGSEVLGVAADARELEGCVQVLAAMWTDGAIERGEAEAGRDLRGDDAVELVLAGDARAEGEGLKDIAGVVVEGGDGRAREAVRQADARHTG